MALPKSHRLSLRFAKDRLNKTGQSSFGQFFTIVSQKQDPLLNNTPRIAILLSKKTASLATDRNKIKRITSTLVQPLLSTLSAKDYLIIPKRQVLTTSFQDLQKDLATILAKN